MHRDPRRPAALNGVYSHLQRRLIEESDELSGEQHHHLLSQELCRQEQTCREKAEGRLTQKHAPVETVNYKFPQAHYVGIKKRGSFKTRLTKQEQFFVSVFPADTPVHPEKKKGMKEKGIAPLQKFFNFSFFWTQISLMDLDGKEQ